MLLRIDVHEVGPGLVGDVFLERDLADIIAAGEHLAAQGLVIIGDAEAITLALARSQARTLLASLRIGEETVPVASVMFETAAEEVFRRYRRNWKPRTLEINLSYYRNQILPCSEENRLPKSRAGTSGSGSHHSLRRRLPRTARHRSFP